MHMKISLNVSPKEEKCFHSYWKSMLIIRAISIKVYNFLKLNK